MTEQKKKSKNPFVIILGNKKWQFISIPIFCIICGCLAVSIIIFIMTFFQNGFPSSFSAFGSAAAAGFEKIGVTFQSLLQGSGILPKSNYSNHKSMLTDFMDTLDAMTPMLFAALSVAVALKAGLFNIGVSGQMLFSGFMATVLVGYSNMPSALAWPLTLLVGIASGALIGGLIGFLKYKFNINEVVSSIMLNYILQYIISFVINTQYIDPVNRTSKKISDASRLTLMNVEIGDLKMRIPLCFLLAILLAILLQFFFSRTKQGYELKAVGLNPIAAKYAGIKVGYNTVFAMLLSGAFAGLAGVSYYMGQYNTITPNSLTSIGFDSIAVSLLGNSHPIGIIFSSFLITTISNGSSYMSSTAKLKPEITSLIIGFILLFSACGSYVKSKANKQSSSKKSDEKSVSKAVAKEETK